MHEIARIHDAVARLIAEEKAGLLITVTRTEGSTYRRPGACSVIGEDGTITGAISGGCVERDIAERAKTWLADFSPRTVTYDSSSSDDIVFGLGLGCRGKIEMLVQPFDAAHPPELPAIPRQAVAIIGRGPDTEPVAAVARAAGWTAEILRSYDAPPLDDFDAVVIMTHNFLHDVALLSRALASPARYIGLLGPKSRGEEILTQIGDVTPAMRARLHNPIGLDLGGDSPEAVALSIVAEMQAVFSGGTGEPLREKRGPIHRVKTVAVVLAAGGSSRLGRPKQLVEFRGEPLIVHAVRVAQGAGCDRTLVVWSDPAVASLLRGVELIENREWREGIANSIRLAVEAAGEARILFTLSDQPRVTSDHLRQLVASPAPIAATGYRGVAGVPAAFGPQFRGELLALRGDSGARALIEAHGAAVIPCEDAAMDVDREEDLRTLG